MAQAKYTSDDIQVLEGLDPVRKRPAMYIGGTGKDGYHHLLWEVVDNSIDEVINKYASKVEVTLHKDGKSATVEDNGRGIPVDMMPKFKKSALEVIFSTLHSGGKFERGKSYAVSGGLHGVGAAVVNALSSELLVTVKRDGERHEMRFERGETKSKLKNLGNARGSGTTVTFRPDDEVFGGKLHFDAEAIAERLEAKAYLHAGLEIVFVDETTSPKQTHTYLHPQGIAEYLPKPGVCQDALRSVSQGDGVADRHFDRVNTVDQLRGEDGQIGDNRGASTRHRFVNREAITFRTGHRDHPISHPIEARHALRPILGIQPVNDPLELKVCNEFLYLSQAVFFHIIPEEYNPEVADDMPEAFDGRQSDVVVVDTSDSSWTQDYRRVQ